MTTPHAQILKAFKIGYWKINTTSGLITLDDNITSIFDTQTSELSYDELFGLVVPEQRVGFITKLNSYPRETIQDFSFRLYIHNVMYTAEIVMDDTLSDHILSGGVRFEEYQKHGSGDHIREQKQNTETDNELEDECRLRAIVNCRMSMFPCTLFFQTRHMEINVYDNQVLSQRVVSIEEFANSIHKDNRAEYTCYLQLFHDQYQPKTIQLIFRSNYMNGKYQWYELQCELIYDQHCNLPVKYIGVLHNIDLQKREDKLLKRNVDFFTSIFQHIPVGVELYNSKGELIEYNHKTCEIFGIDQHPHSTLPNLVLFDDPALPSSFKEAIRAGQQISTEIDYDLSLVKPYYSTLRTGVLTLQSRGVPILDADNNILYYILVHMDDTENSHARKQANDFENFFSAIAEFASIGYCKWDIISHSGFAIDQWLVNMGEEPGSDISDIIKYLRHIHPNDKAKLYQSLKQMLRGEIFSIQHELRILDDKTNSYKWIYHHAIVTKYAPQDGSIEVVIVNTDISKLKRTKQQLLQANMHATELIAQRDLVINNLSSGLVYIDTDYVIQWGNIKAVSHIFGPSSYKTGSKCYETTFNRSEPCEHCPLALMIQTKGPVTHHIRHNGAFIEIMANPAFDSLGNLLGGIVKLDDITIREQNELKIKELNYLMDAILNNIPVYLFVKDPNNDFKYLYWNKATAERTKIPTSNAIGKNDFEILYNAEDATKLHDNDLQLIANGKSIEQEEQMYDTDGKMHYFNTVRLLIPTEDKLPWILGFSWNITELKKYEAELIKAKEKAEESDKFKSSFLANMSHEIRTPLNAIVGFSELLMDNSIDQADRIEYLNIIKKNNHLLLQLISDILDLSRIEAGMINYTYDKVDINTLCNRIAMSCRLRNEVKVPILFNEHLPQCYVISDENRINQVLTNLITNAIKFTHKGSIQIGYRLLNDTELEIYVKDTGMGISPDKIGSVFDRFVKLDSFVQGTGLGLSICKNLIEHLGGRISVESEVDRGSRFSFVIPYDKESDNMNFNNVVVTKTL